MSSKIPNSKFILFDFDGTINDSSKYAYETANAILATLKKEPLTYEQFEQFRNVDLKRSVKDLRIPFYKIPKILLQVQKAFNDNLDKIGVVEDLAPVLHALCESGYRLGILTSNSEENVRNLLSREGVEQLFEFIRSEKALFGKSKAMRHFIKSSGIAANQIVYVGDEIRDIIASHKAGLSVISVGWGMNSVEGLKNQNPDYLVENVQQFRDLFELAD